MSLETTTTNETAPAPEVSAPTEVAQTNATPSETSTEGVDDSNVNQVEKTFTQTELNEIVQKQKAKAEARAERRATQAYKEALESVTRGQPQQSRAATEPTRDQFASDAEWIDAKVEQKLHTRDSAEREKHLFTTTEAIYAKAEKIAGFDRGDFNELPLTDPMVRALVECSNAPQVMAWMASNPGDVERISQLSASRQAIEIGRLESRLETVVKKSNVPAPITPIGAKGSASTSLANADFADYKKQRALSGAKWAR